MQEMTAIEANKSKSTEIVQTEADSLILRKVLSKNGTEIAF